MCRSPPCRRPSPNFERELNVTLINRGHNYQGLTPEGERLVEWAKQILAEQEVFKEAVAAVRSGIYRDSAARDGTHRVDDTGTSRRGVVLGPPGGQSSG